MKTENKTEKPLTRKEIFLNLKALTDMNPAYIDFKVYRKLFREALKAYDFLYSYSDDPYIYKLGTYEATILRKAIETHPRLYPVWNIYYNQQIAGYNKTDEKKEERKS